MSIAIIAGANTKNVQMVKSTGVTFGYNSGTAVYAEAPNRIDFTRVQNTAGAGPLTALEIMFNQATGAGKIRLGLYSDNNNAVGSLLIDAGEVSAGPGWVGIYGLNGPALALNSYYWIAVVMSAPNTIEYLNSGSANNHAAVETFAYGPLPVNPIMTTPNWNTPYVMRGTVNAGTGPVAPTVVTNPATAIGSAAATMNGNLTSLGSVSPVAVSFQYGTSTGYGNATLSQNVTAPGIFTANLSGLSPSTVYHYRTVAVGSSIVYGGDQVFTTTPVVTGLKKVGCYYYGGWSSGIRDRLIAVKVMFVVLDIGVWPSVPNADIATCKNAGITMCAYIPTGGLRGFIWNAQDTTDKTPAGIKTLVDAAFAKGFNGVFFDEGGVYTPVSGQSYTDAYLDTTLPSPGVPASTVNTAIISISGNSKYNPTTAAAWVGKTVMEYIGYAKAHGMFVCVGCPDDYVRASRINSNIFAQVDAVLTAENYDKRAPGLAPVGQEVANTAKCWVLATKSSGGSGFYNSSASNTAISDGFGAVYCCVEMNTLDADGNGVTFEAYMAAITGGVTPVSPTVVTNAASFITATGATLNGNLSSLGSVSPVTVGFDYGLTTSYGTSTPTANMTAAGAFATILGGLTPGTTYHFRAKAIGSSTVYGADQSFTTPAITSTNVVGYISEESLAGGVPLSSIKLEQATYALYSAIQVTSATNPALVDHITRAASFPVLDQVVAAGHAKATKVFAMLYGDDKGVGTLETIVASSSLRAQLVTNLINLVQAHNLDGIDVDWEGTTQTRALNDMLMIALANALHAIGKQIGAAAAPDYASRQIFASPSTVINYLNFVSLMTYHITDITTIKSSYLDAWASDGYPNGKLAIGVPFFGHDSASLEVNYSWIIDNLNPSASQNQATIATVNGQPVQGGILYWSSINQAKAVVDYVKANGYFGTMVFEMGEDKLNDSRSLLQNIYNEANGIIPVGYKNVTYMNDYYIASATPANIQFQFMTHFGFTGVKVTSATDPTLAWQNSYSTITPPTLLTQCVTLAHAKGCKVMLVLYGEGDTSDTNIYAILKNATTRAQLVTNLKNMVTQYNCDGVDLDWEGSDTATDRVAVFDQFVLDLYNALHPIGKIISVYCFGTWFEISPSTQQYIEWICVGEYVGNRPVTTAAAECDPYLNAWVAAGFTPAKMLMKIYSSGVDPVNGSRCSYANLLDVLNPASNVNNANVTSITPGYYPPSTPISGGVLSWEGVDFIHSMAAYAVSKGLGGLMYFDEGEDKIGDPRSQLKAIYDGFTNPVPSVVQGGTYGLLSPTSDNLWYLATAQKFNQIFARFSKPWIWAQPQYNAGYSADVSAIAAAVKNNGGRIFLRCYFWDDYAIYSKISMDSTTGYPVQGWTDLRNNPALYQEAANYMAIQINACGVANLAGYTISEEEPQLGGGDDGAHAPNVSDFIYGYNQLYTLMKAKFPTLSIMANPHSLSLFTDAQVLSMSMDMMECHSYESNLTQLQAYIARGVSLAAQMGVEFFTTVYGGTSYASDPSGALAYIAQAIAIAKAAGAKNIAIYAANECNSGPQIGQSGNMLFGTYQSGLTTNPAVDPLQHQQANIAAIAGM